MPIRQRSPVFKSALVSAAFVYCTAFGAAQTENFSGRVVTVVDGDTIGVLRDGHEVRVRLDGIDAPESGQDFWEQAKQFMTDAAFNKVVAVSGHELDRYGRLIARVTVDGRDLSVAAIEAGFAWHFVRYANDPILAAAEARARTHRLGLWAQPGATPPWEYRGPSAGSSVGAPAVTPSR